MKKINHTFQNTTDKKPGKFLRTSELYTIKSVAIIIPCRNEEKYIVRCLDSLLANDYDKRLIEIIIVDGMSVDRTRDILAEYCQQHNFFKVLDNPKKITPVALNIAIRASKSDVILRADAHAVYAPNYISTLVQGLDKYQADNIGGIRKTALIKDTTLSLGLSIATSHPFTAGNAYYRTGSNKVREVDTVFCGCFPIKLFEKIGFFNEEIIRTEDRDFNARILESGGKIILEPRTKCTYFPRTNFWEYFMWNAYGPFRLFYNHKFTHANMASWRNMIPAAFVVSQLAALVAFGFSTGLGLLFSLPFFVYWIVAIFLSIQVAIKHRSFALAPVMIVVFAVTHYGYGIGSLLGMPWYFLRSKRRT